MAEERRQIIEQALREGLSPSHLEIENESRKHHVPPGSQTHFKVVVVSEAFQGLSLVERHRKVHALLAQELRKGLHALALKTETPAEWQARPEGFRSPPCAGAPSSKDVS